MAILSLKLTSQNPSPVLSFENKILVRPGERVEKGQVLARIIKSEMVQVAISSELGVKIKDVVKHLLKKKGDKVQIGDILAKYKNIFSTKTLKSPVNGEVIHFNPEQGTLTIKIAAGTKEIKSVVKGEIIDKDNEEINIKFEGEEFSGHSGRGEKVGTLQMVKDKNEYVDIFGLNREFTDSIVLGEKWTKEALAKAKALDCGVVGVEFPWELETLTSNNLNNFAILEIDRETFGKLKNLLHKKVYLAGYLKKLIYQP